jgi:hypothetical protein
MVPRSPAPVAGRSTTTGAAAQRTAETVPSVLPVLVVAGAMRDAPAAVAALPEVVEDWGVSTATSWGRDHAMPGYGSTADPPHRANNTGTSTRFKNVEVSSPPRIT